MKYRYGIQSSGIKLLYILNFTSIRLNKRKMIRHKHISGGNEWEKKEQKNGMRDEAFRKSFPSPKCHYNLSDRFM